MKSEQLKPYRKSGFKIALPSKEFDNHLYSNRKLLLCGKEETKEMS